MSEAAITEDRLLGGKVILRQPAEGFRAAIDPVFLAASVPVEPGQSVLDLGAGTGAASLCLARRVAGCRVTGLELQPDLVRLAGDNAALNELPVTFMAGDVAAPPPRLAPGGFDHVMANPPFLAAGSGTLPPGSARALAMGEGAADLAIWVRTALAMARARGTITFIHRADRLDALLGALSGRAGDIAIFPLWPGVGKPARRILLRARRDSAAPLRLAAGLVLHEADGRYTQAADAVLRDGQGLTL